MAEVNPAPIHRLDIANSFDSLSPKERLYAHYMSQAAWKGTKIVLRQVSPEALAIFELIMELHDALEGRWNDLKTLAAWSDDYIYHFLEYAATFLSNQGNYYGSGDQKFIPAVSKDAFLSLGKISKQAASLVEQVADQAYAIPPYSLGFPSTTSQSAYYPDSSISKGEIAAISKTLEKNGIFPENTRVRKNEQSAETHCEVLQASASDFSKSTNYLVEDLKSYVRLVPGDHSAELNAICTELKQAVAYAADERQRTFLEKYIESFESGSLEAYRESQRTWVSDIAPRVENIFGFVEPYRDPFGIRAEWEALVAISDREESRRLQHLVANSTKFIRRLPWADGYSENDGKGPFEKSLFEPPDLASINALAYCSSIVFPGINLPNYNDIRQECGFKNVIIANRMSAESSNAGSSPFVDPSEAAIFQDHKFAAYYLWVVLHELLGHGTGKMMCEISEGSFNFDRSDPPINPLTKKPIQSYYRPGQTWTGQFEDLATTLDECRAELVGAYLMDDMELLALFGFTESSNITASDLTYNMYLQLGVDGLKGLRNFNVDANSWGQAHSQAHFATLKWLLQDASGAIKINVDTKSSNLTVRVDRQRILSHLKPSLGRMLLRLHIYRCTADVAACRQYYEELSKVEGEFLDWREIVVANQLPKWKFVQANTFLRGDEVQLKEYDATDEGIIQSWAERRC